MKNIKLFVGIASVFLLMFVLISCDVFDRRFTSTGSPEQGSQAGQWGRNVQGDPNKVNPAPGEDIGAKGKLYDSFDNTPDTNMATANEKVYENYKNNYENSQPNHPYAEIDLLPRSRYVYFSKDFNIGTQSGTVYVVINDAITPSVPDLWLMAQTNVCLELAEYYGLDPKDAVGSAANANKSLSTIQMKKARRSVLNGLINENTLVTGTQSAEVFYLDFPFNFKARTTNSGWFPQGVRMEFINVASPGGWDGPRISLAAKKGTKAKNSMSTPISTYFADPFTPNADDFGEHYQIRLEFDNRLFFVPR